ncbi:unnamed protein product [Rotaria magnacalcarata]
MADNMQEESNHYDVKQWQHCSLFNLDLFNDEHDHLNLNKDIINNIHIDGCCCSLSTPNVDDSFRKKYLNHSCSFAVLQKNYTTQLEHVAEKLLSNETNTINHCCCCSIYETNDTKVQSLNRKILLGSTAILDNFLRNNLKTSLLTNSNNPPPPPPSSSSTTTTTTTSNINITSTVIASGNNPRRWHSERGSRHTNVRANLPLTIAQRQVLERYMNYPIIKRPTNIHSNHRSHHRQPITGKVIENTGTALSTLTEQPLNTTTPMVNTTMHVQKNSTSLNNAHQRQVFSSLSSTTAHHSTLNRQLFLVDKIEDSQNDNSHEHPSISSSQLDEHHELSILPEALNPHSNLSETLSPCAICCELKCLQKRPCCNFYVCSTCISVYVEQKIEQGVISIQCPNQQCHMFIHRDEIHKRCISPEIRQKLTRFLIENNRSINIKTCPRCSNIHEIDIELCRSMRQAPTKVQCVECNLIWCFQCHSPWHDGIQCKEFRRGDRMLKKWAREVHYGQHNAQQCPSCKVYIQRTNGCDHIVCVRCKTEFCYKCGDRFRDIKFIGDHYSELSVLGCKYRFYPDNPLKRRLIRGSILGGKILAAPIVLCLAVVTGAVCASIGFPAYCCFMLVRQIKASRRKHRLATAKEPVLMSYKALNNTVPQLIPREPVNMSGIKPGFNSIRSIIPNHNGTEIDLPNNAPIAIFDECDIHISTNQKGSL